MKKLKFGKAFNDELKKYSFKTGHFYKKSSGSIEWTESLFNGVGESSQHTSLLSPWRKIFLVICIMITFFGLSLRLFHLQVTQGKENRELADSNRIQVRVIHAPRGVIYDRNGKILAQNDPGFRLKEASSGGKISFRSITRQEALDLEIKNDQLSQNIEVDNIRTYPFAEKTAHVLGYVGEITEDELKEPEFVNYKLGDKIGRGGVEEAYEKVLKGTDGGEIIEVDASGKKIRTLRETAAVSGQNIYLTLDVDLQSHAFDKLAENIKKSSSCCGALVAQDPRNGEVLALVSYPSYNPKKLSEALLDPNAPLLNRAIGGTYPPGSTFKLASALAGLSSGRITAQTKYEDTGVLSLGPFTFANWYFTQHGRKEEGGVDVVRALKRSNDIYFYQLAIATNEKIIGDYSKKLNLGKKVGIDIPGEVDGLIPDNEWKVNQFNEVWYPGDTLHMSIGQGFVLSTPLQINNLTMIFAENGVMYPPHLALKITRPTGELIKEFRYDGEKIKDIKRSDIDVIKEGLAEVPKEGGTAWPFFTFPIPTAGKTGTAEFGDPKNKTHAWYTGYAPVQDPTIVATSLIEAGGEGSTNASPIVKEVFRYYFSPEKNNLIRDLGQIATESARTLGE
jgi:penicillin-binding protein 2